MASKSNFNSALQGSAYFGFTDTDGSKIIVRTQGDTFVKRLQKALKSYLSFYGDAAINVYKDADGKMLTVKASDINVDGVWGPNTNRALSAVSFMVLKGSDASPSELDGMTQEMARGEFSKSISPHALLLAIYAAYYPKDNPHRDGVKMFNGTVVPPFGHSPPSSHTDLSDYTLPVDANESFESVASSMEDGKPPPKPGTTPTVKPPVTPPATQPGTDIVSPQSGMTTTSKALAIGALVVAGGGLAYALWPRSKRRR